MHTATFFITTARSGTQWVSATLRALYPDLLSVEHEPIKYSYAPRRCLRNPDELTRLSTVPTVRRHLDDVRNTLKSRAYVEAGFPAFAAAPLLLKEFGERLRLVQLVRHPARVAASIVTHRWYEPGARPDIEADVALTPSDRGVCLRQYARQWPTMSPFEKALFFWAEVHLYGLEVERTLSTVPFLRIRFEDLLANRDARASFARFLDLPYRTAFDRAPEASIDQFRKRTMADIELGKITELPEIVGLATGFGYRTGAEREAEFHARYRTSWLTRARRRLRAALGLRRLRL
jgi:hypothetical protein